jgi:vacuolar-type H+-ATPase subunit H
LPIGEEIMQADIIRQVRDAEIRAEQKTADAKAKADDILHEARRHAVEARLEILETARQHARDLFERGAKEFEPEIAQLHQGFQTEIASETTLAQQRFETSVDFVVTKFYEQFGRE